MRSEQEYPPLMTILGLVFIAMLAVTFIYELAKQLLIPSIPIWESHSITILFTSIVSVVILFFPLRSLYREQEKTRAALRNQQEAEARLRQSEARYRSFVESVEESIYTVDPDLRYLLINTRHLARRGLLQEVYTGKTYADFHTTEETAVFQAQVRKVITTGMPMQDEYGQGGHYYLRRLNPVIDPEDNAVTAITVISSDITQRKYAEDALCRVNKKLTTLSTITRHDIKNQLLALSGYLELSEHIPDNIPLTREYLQKELKIAETIGRQIDFTKVYEDMGTMNPVWQNVHESIRRAVAALPMRDIRVDVDRHDLEIFADPLFEKVFYNLLDNALKYGGASMTKIRIGSHDTSDGLVLICEDNGVGITKEDKSRLFTQGFGKNTGLGLFLIREILAITGISIRETGEPGGGCRFEMIVPAIAYRFTPGRS
jgi:PAS domain S-box-containing protein